MIRGRHTLEIGEKPDSSSWRIPVLEKPGILGRLVGNIVEVIMNADRTRLIVMSEKFRLGIDSSAKQPSPSTR